MTNAGAILISAILLAACSSGRSRSTSIATSSGPAAASSGVSSSATGSGSGGQAGSGGATGTGGGQDAGSGTLVPTTTRTALLSNNTSASSAFTDVYTPATRFNGSATPISNGDAPASTTPLVDLTHGVVSKVSLHTLLPAAATTKVFVETQAWFCTNGTVPIPTAANADQCGSHIDPGYDSNAADHVHTAVADMMSRGVDGALLDWVGQAAGLGAIGVHSTDAAAINTGNVSLVMKEAEASGGRFSFALLEDEGVKACAAQAGCDVTAQIVSDLDFIAAHFFPSPAYQTIAGRPVVYFFSVDTWVATYNKTIDWTTVRAQIASNPVLVFENAGGFTHAESGGAYAWLSVTPIGSYPGSDPFGTAAFLPYFYKQAAAYAALYRVGSAYKGFDDGLVNGWGGGRRYTGQQCGKTLLDTMKAANAAASGSTPIDAVQIATWDDYEEGSEVETGIESYVAITGAVKGSTLSWSIAPASNAPMDCTQAIAAGLSLTDTVHHFEVYASPAADGEQLARIGADVPAGTTSLDLTGLLPLRSYLIYVYAVGQPMIRNHLSSAVPFSL